MFLAFLDHRPSALRRARGGRSRTSTSYLLVERGDLGGGALWGALVFPLLLRGASVSPQRPEPWPRDDVIAYTITITALCAASRLAILIWWPGSELGLARATVLAVTGWALRRAVHGTVDRVGGTLMGSQLP